MNIYTIPEARNSIRNYVQNNIQYIINCNIWDNTTPDISSNVNGNIWEHADRDIIRNCWGEIRMHQ